MKNTIGIAAILACTAAIGQKESMTPERLWELGRVSLECVEPNGKSFIYGLTQYDLEANSGERNLYKLSSKGGSPQQLTSQKGGEYAAIYYGDKIGYAYKGQYYLAGANGEEPMAITDFSVSASNFKAIPLQDGRLALLFSISVKLEETTEDLYPQYPKAEVRVIDNLMYRHWDSWSDAEYNHLCLAFYEGKGEKSVRAFVDLMQGEPFDCPVNPFGGSESYTISPDGKVVIYESKKLTPGVEWAQSTNTDLYRVDVDNMVTTKLTGGLMGYDKEPKFSPDGSKLAWLSMATDGYESDVNDLIVMEVKSGKRIAVLRDANRYDDISFQSYAWSGNNSLYVGVPEAGSNQIYLVELDKKLGEGKSKFSKVSAGDFNWNHFEVAGGDLIVERQDMNHATEIFSLNPKKSKWEKLTQVNDAIYAKTAMSKVEKRMVKTSDGKEMLTWVIFPPDFDPTKKYPTLLYCQGGPQSQVSQFYSFRWNFQLMAAQGYIVVAPNRRGLPGFGREWNEAISKDWGGQAMRDYLAAIDDVSKESWSDENQLGCVGASYGGYSAYMLAGIHEKRFDAFIAHCGLFDLEHWYLTTEELFFANYDLGGPYWKPENKAVYEQFDPKNYVQNWDTPLLVIHGGKDFRVPESQGMAAFQAAQIQNIPSRFLYFPEEGHWVLLPQNGMIWHSEFFSWLDRWLKDAN